MENQPNSNNSNNSNADRKSNRGGARAGAGRPKKFKLSVPAAPDPAAQTKEEIKEQIASIKQKLAENPPAKEFAALSRTLAILTGGLVTYKRKKPEPEPTEPESKDGFPLWWISKTISTGESISFGKIRVYESWRGQSGTGPVDSFAKWWAQEEGITAEELYKRMVAERRANYSESGKNLRVEQEAHDEGGRS